MKFDFSKTTTLLFDFDGTLVDSVPDLALAVNNMLKTLNRPVFDIETIRGWVGNGPELLIKRALSGSTEPDPFLDNEIFENALNVYLEFYERDICVNTKLYDGVKESLKALKGKFSMVIITNKSERFVQPILEGLGIDGNFDLIIGCDSLPERKPSPEPLLHAAKKLGAQKMQCLMVGDSKNDILAAKAANVPSVGVSYGYNYGTPIAQYEPDYVIDTFSELLKLLRL